jgi:sulfur carrier protein
MNLHPALSADVFVDAETPGAVAIVVNGVQRHVPAGTTLAGLIQGLGRSPEMVATAVNDRFVPRGARQAVVLTAGDTVACFEPIVGG